MAIYFLVARYLDADLGPDRGKGVSRLLLEHLGGSLVAEVVVLLHELLRGNLGLLGADLLPHVHLRGGLGQDLLWPCGGGEIERARTHKKADQRRVRLLCCEYLSLFAWYACVCVVCCVKPPAGQWSEGCRYRERPGLFSAHVRI